jgi:Sec-independent protein translocase protein TatA
MSLARGIGAAFEGFTKGVRFAGEEEDRRLRQELAAKQMEAADLQLEQSRRERDYQNEIKPPSQRKAVSQARWWTSSASISVA